MRMRSVHVANGSAILCLDSKVIGSSALKSEEFSEEAIPVGDKLHTILQDFDASMVCSGVQDPKYASIKYVPEESMTMESGDPPIVSIL